MFSLSGKIRENKGKKSGSKDVIPAVLYGPEIKSQSIEVNLGNFEKIYEKAGESSLINLKLNSLTNSEQTKEYKILIHEIQRDPLSGKIIHVDFYQPNLTKEVEVEVPIVFEGESPAVKDLGGTLVKEIQEIEVKALPHNLPHEIKVNIEKLKTFDDEIVVKDLDVPENVKITREPDEIIANVSEPTKVEEELEKPIEEEIEKAEEKEEEEESKKEEESVSAESSGEAKKEKKE